jgi:ABC-type transport system involved in multi-copper enzyme maturation permease subunit
LIANPIIRRELVTTLRSPRALGLQVLLLGALSALVLLRWPMDARADLDGVRAREVFTIFAYGLMTAMILLTPVFPAATLVREKRSGTLALLLNSPLSRWDIVVGKLIGVLGYVFLLLIVSIPAAAACYAMGGIDLYGQLLLGYAVLAVLAVQYATLGLLVSSLAQTTDGAMRATYGLILGLALLVMGPYQFLGGADWLAPGQAAVIDWLRCLSPIPAIMEVVGQGQAAGVGAAGAMVTGMAAQRYLLLGLVSSAGFVLWTVKRMDLKLFDRGRSSGTVTDERSTAVKAYRRVMYLWFFDPQRRSGLIGPFTNPVMVKEFRTRRFGRGHWMMRLIGSCLIVSLALMLAASSGTISYGVDTLGGVVVLLQVALIVLLTPSLAAGLISTERESGGWQLLQLTPLPATRIVTGKILSVSWTLLLVLLATLPAYAVLMAIQPQMMPVVLKVIATLALTAAFAVLVSAAVSSLFRRTAPATSTAYAIVIALCLGTLLVWLSEDAPFTRATVEKVLMVNPLAAALQLIRAPGFAHYRLTPMNWWIMGGGCAAALLVLIVQTWRLTRPR